VIKLIMFDLDGTLVDSKVDIANALNYALRPCGFAEITVEKTVSMIGEGVNRLIEKVLGEEQSGLFQSVLERFITYYSAHLMDHTVPYPGVRSTLEKLAEYRKVVISNKRESLSRKLLGHLDLSAYFDDILGSDSVGCKKPSPAPLIHILEKMDFSPDEAVIIGDSNYDVEAGRAAGVGTVAVTYGYRSPEFLSDADIMVDRFDEIPSVVAAFSPVVGKREGLKS
jgi:phosphoglycolate phosphatase